MKKLLIYILFFAITFTAGAQSKYAKKVEKLFNKGKFEKCISKSKKYLRKEKKSAEIQQFVVKSNYALYNLSEKEAKKQSYLKKSISAFEKLNKYNTKQQDYSEIKDSVYFAIKLYCNKYTSGNKAFYYHKKLAKNFGDTTDVYISFFKKTIVKSEPIAYKTDTLEEIRQLILKTAKNLIGVKYKYGGTDSTGFDCSGFTQYVYNSVGIKLPHNADKQSKLGKNVNLRNAKPGDLIFFGSNRAFHAGMIFNNTNGQIELIHCVSGGVSHQESENQNTKYWLERVLCVKEMISCEELTEK